GHDAALEPHADAADVAVLPPRPQHALRHALLERFADVRGCRPSRRAAKRRAAPALDYRLAVVVRNSALAGSRQADRLDAARSVSVPRRLPLLAGVPRVRARVPALSAAAAAGAATRASDARAEARLHRSIAPADRRAVALAGAHRTRE